MALGNDKVGKLVLRLALGVIVLLHGIAKLQGGIDGIMGMVASHGLPEQFAYAVYVGEVIAPLMVILGFYARIGGLLIAINMAVAVFLAHAKDVFALSEQGGWAIELQGLMFFAALGVMFLGPGKPAINDK
jgi:putative oxidoreductase